MLSENFRDYTEKYISPRESVPVKRDKSTSPAKILPIVRGICESQGLLKKFLVFFLLITLSMVLDH